MLYTDSCLRYAAGALRLPLRLRRADERYDAAAIERRAALQRAAYARRVVTAARLMLLFYDAAVTYATPCFFDTTLFDAAADAVAAKAYATLRCHARERVNHDTFSARAID